MSKQVAKVEIHAVETSDSGHEDLDVSVDLIDDNLYLGNLACARDNKKLESLHVTHILTIDLVPLPRSILDRPNINFEYLKLADVPKEDLVTNLPAAIEYIKSAIAGGGTILVHCYFGVSRSAAIVIAYIMQKYGLCYEEAFTLVKSKRRFIGPNVGFVAQLKLFGHMGCKIDKDDPRFKQFRLKMAGQKLKQVKILPQSFADLVKADPGLARERPDPMVYRCKKCRRVLASQGNIIPHIPKQVKIELAKKGLGPVSSGGVSCSQWPESAPALVERLRQLAQRALDCSDEASVCAGSSGSSQEERLDGYTEESLVDGHILGRDVAACRLMWFVEPLRWMADVGTKPSGKLHCPKCQNKIGSFSWVMGCKCPCGQKVAPAFYLVPSKVESSNIVQNVQITV